MPNGAKRWVFTLNNPTDDEEQAIGDFVEFTEYLVFGRETGAEGNTPHLQGYFILKSRRTLQFIKSKLGDRIHLEISRGTPAQASDYCKKDGDFEEFGEIPASNQGKRSDWERYRDWLKEQDGCPTEKQIAEAHPSIWGRYRNNALVMAEMYHPVGDMVPDTPFPWQQALADDLGEATDDRRVFFVVDPEGGEGKSWFGRWMLQKFPDQVQLLGMGKRDDMAHMVDRHKRVFLINVGRGQMKMLQYSILEQLKDRNVSSPKYDSCMKRMIHQPQICVFSNEIPNLLALTEDRYHFWTHENAPHFMTAEAVKQRFEQDREARLAREDYQARAQMS